MNVFFVYGTDTPRHAAPDRIDPRGHHPRQHHAARPDRGMTVEERDVTARRVARGRRIRRRSPRCSPAAPPPSSRRSPSSRRKDFDIGDADAPAGEITMALRQELTDIQYGRRPDRHGWLTRLDA